MVAVAVLRTGKLQIVDMTLLFFTEFIEWKWNRDHVMGCKRQHWLQSPLFLVGGEGGFVLAEWSPSAVSCLCKKPLSHYISSMDPQPRISAHCLNLLFNFHKINWIFKKRSSNYFWKKSPPLKVFKRPCSSLLARDFFLVLQHLLLFQLTWSNHPTSPFLSSPPGSKASSASCAGCFVMRSVPPLSASVDNELLDKILNFYRLLLA